MQRNLGITVTAKPAKWKRDRQIGQWVDQTYGFCVWLDKMYQLPAFANWDSGMACDMLDESEQNREKQFSTIQEAKDWCQAQADAWIARHAVLTPNV